MDSTSFIDSDSPLSEEYMLSDYEQDTETNDGQETQLKTELEHLGVGLEDQNTLEQRIMAEADKALADRDEEREQKRLDKARKQARDARDLLSELRSKLKDNNGASQRDRLTKKINEQATLLRNANRDESDIMKRMEERQRPNEDTTMDSNDHSKRQVNESWKEYLIRTGKITPFATVEDTELALAEEHDPNIILPGSGGHHIVQQNRKRPRALSESIDLTKEIETNWRLSKAARQDMDQYNFGTEEEDEEDDEDENYSDEYDDGMMDISNNDEEWEPKSRNEIAKLYEDDGIEANYKDRLGKWIDSRKHLRSQKTTDEDEPMVQQDDNEIYQPHPYYPDARFGALRVPGEIWQKLFDYQKTCVQWLWELHNQKVGGIIGDEMGLGKTVQITAFLAGLYYSKLLGPGMPSIVVCPATVLKQWVEEFHRWWPPLRVAILHASGSGIRTGNADLDDFVVDDIELYDSMDNEEYEPDRRGRGRPAGNKKKSRSRQSLFSTKGGKKAAAVVDQFIKNGGILVTTYGGVQTYREVLLKHRWGYVILDEGHKIRNPDSETTLACKQFKTPHRVILSGTPIQNNLKELWSLFDFIFPGRLGTLPVFQSQFSVPINIGGYANASNIQVQTAYKCACMLRDLINPYLLRRMKVDVATDLPKKSEQVLFCKLTPSQRQSYLQFIHSKEMDKILERRRQALFGIDIVRKICNHPDIVNMATMKQDASYGDPEQSGKMVVVRALLNLWQGKHRILLFCQTKQMLDILQMMIEKLGYRYLRMDGTTPVQHRMTMVHEFNTTPDIYVFLLTTKVGGLGLNLTGADRVILFDPDWNPSTDMQARERAWRLGQTKDVTIYRLMTSGTIEEKIYHRQIYKQFLTNKILKDPKQQRFFDASNLKALFTLGAEDDTSTETGRLFEGTEIKRKKKPDHDKEEIQKLQGVSNIKPIENDKDKSEGSDKKPSGGDDNVLSSLFEMTGIQSALQHDRIMESSAQDSFFVEREATMIAEKAVAALKESRKHTRSNTIGVPTWTGKSGYAGSPIQRSSPASIPPPRFGQKTTLLPGSSSSTKSASTLIPSSSDSGFGKGVISGFKGPSKMVGSNTLLAQMKQRKDMMEGGTPLTATSDSPIGSPSLLTDKEKLVEKLVDYLASHGGQSGTREIMDNVQMNIGQSDVVVFRKMIQAIATFGKDQNGQGIWKLKQEFV